MKQILFLLGLLSIACTQSKTKKIWADSQVTDTIYPLPKFEPKEGLSYTNCKIGVAQKRKSLLNASTDSLSTTFTNLLLKELIPYWYDTPWSFDGHPEQPGTKPVACSYFVSTVLRDAGLQINRYTLAQQLPEHEAKSLAQPSNCLVFENKNTIATLNTIRATLPEGIHFIGFGTIHVGFVLKQNNRLYLIHSYYKKNVGVIIEDAFLSEVPEMCDHFFITPMSGNSAFLNKWLEGKKFETVKG